MHVIATAGHVDHGKSALVRAITGMEPDRWAEERRRGMTIDLGYAWSTLPSGTELAFVDVPGHQRFIGNMLAGLGPAPAVLFVVAADQGWSRQSHEHLAAINGLELAHGVLAITRSDLADPHNATSEAIDHLAASSLGRVNAVAVSATTGQGLPELLTALDRLVDKLPQPFTTGRVRLWIDRAFTIRGSGTVVTGTLGEGTLSVGDELELDGQLVRVRSLQRLGQDTSTVSAVARVAVNLRSVKPDQVHRGAALITPERWRHTSTLDVRSDRTEPLATQLVLHLGTASVAVRTRQLGGKHHRLHLHRALPIRVGDRALLRDPGTASIAAAVQVLDTAPPALSRRGDARRRAEELATATAQDSPAAEIHRRGAVLRRDLELDDAELPPEIKNAGDWLVSPRLWAGWLSALSAAVDTHSQQSPLAPQMPLDAARRVVGAPDLAVIRALAEEANLTVTNGRISRPGTQPSLGAAEEGLLQLELRLQKFPFDAASHPDLASWSIGPREIAAAERLGRLVRISDDVALLPSGPAEAVAVLRNLPQPFTTSEARQALGATRRVAIPLLEYLDEQGSTRRVSATHREVV